MAKKHHVPPKKRNNSDYWAPLTEKRLANDIYLKTINAMMWYMGDLTHMQHPGQRDMTEFLNNKVNEGHNRVVINIPRQFGKTHWVLMDAVAYCIRNPGSNVRYGAPTHKQATDLAVPTIRNILALCPNDMQPKKSRETWTFPNGSIFQIVGIDQDKGDRLRGQSNHMVYLDECRDVSDLEYLVEDVVDESLKTTDGVLVMISTPPKSPSHPFTSRYINEAIGNGTFFHAHWSRSPLIQEKHVKEKIKRLGEDSPSVKREIFADYTVAEEQERVVPYYNGQRQKEFFETYEVPDNIKPYTSVDIGFKKDYTFIVVGFLDMRNACFVCWNEHMAKNMTNRKIYEKLMEMESEFTETPIRITDVDHKFIGEMESEYGITMQNVKKQISTKNEQNVMLNRLNEAFDNERIWVHPRCKNLRFQLETGVWNNAGNDYERSENTGHLDGIDALKYLNLSINYSKYESKKGDILQSRKASIKPRRSIKFINR